MAIVLATQGMVTGTFNPGTFTVGMGHGTTNYYSAAVLMKLDESGPFDLTTLMPSTGGSVTVVGRTSAPSATPTITAGAYTAGQECGGLMTFAVGGAGTSGILESIRVTSKSVQTTTLKLYIFDSTPTNSTWTDHSTAAINVADVPFLHGVFTLASPDSGLGTHTIWNVDGIASAFVAANLYGILVVVGTPTFASTSDLTVKLGIIDD